MKIQALVKNVRISPLKLRPIAGCLVGMQAQEALQTLRWMKQKSARLLWKSVKSAVANAENNLNVPGERLSICEARIDEGVAMKRFQPVSRGSAHPIRKRGRRIKIVLTWDGEKRQAREG